MHVIKQQQLPESTDATSFNTEFRKLCCGFDLLKKTLPDQHKVHKVEQSSLTAIFFDSML